MGIRYDEEELREKIKQMVKSYEACFVDLTLVGYIQLHEDDTKFCKFFLAENIMSGKNTTYKLDWISGYAQETINLLSSSSIHSDYERTKISVVKEWMQEKYGRNVKQNLRGQWFLNDKNEDLKCSLSELEIQKEALDRIYNLVIKDIGKILKTRVKY